MRGVKKLFFKKEYLNKSHFYFINVIFFSILKHGRKSTAMKIFFEILILLRKYYKRLTPLFFSFFKNIYSRLYSKIFLRIQDVGATRYLIPVISIRKSIFLARQWLLKGISNRIERTFSLKMFAELIDIKKYLKRSQSFILKKKYYKQAQNLYTNLQFLKFVKNNSKIIYRSKFNTLFRYNIKFQTTGNNVNFFKKK